MKKIMSVMLLIVTLFSAQPVASANQANTEGVPFHVRPVFTENQVSGAGYFDIEMEPKQKQTLEVIVSNTSDEAIKVKVAANVGVTNSNGLITYDQSTESQPNPDSVSFSDIAKLKADELEVPANSEVAAELVVTMPEESFPGQVLGGLHFELADDESDAEAGVSISNKFAYVIGVVIADGTNKETVEADVLLKSAVAEEVNYRPAVSVSFVNQTAALVQDLVVEGKVFAKGQETVLGERAITTFSIAPNNAFKVPIYLESKLAAGDYIVEVSMQNDDIQWSFDSEFTVAD